MVEYPCGCTFGDDCNGLGTLHCSPPCGGDLCVCVCGGTRECAGCVYCAKGAGGHEFCDDGACRHHYGEELD